MQVQTPVVDVRGVKIGGNNSIVIQSMTNTDTEDIDSTVNQIMELYTAGSELVRVTVNTRKSAESLPEIRRQIGNIGLIGDFHFNGHILLFEYPKAVDALDKIRINPGTSDKKEDKEQFHKMLEIAKDYDKPIRIGVNGGSLDPWILKNLMDENSKLKNPKSSNEVRLQAIVESTYRSAQTALDFGISKEKIILSAKTSNTIDLINIYRTIAKDPRGPYALHLGLTEAGMGSEGIVRSVAALSPLLLDGIGNTIRISLTPIPGEKRSLEVEIAKKLLQDLGLANYYPTTTSCPGCGRTTSTDFQYLTKNTQEYVGNNLSKWIANYGDEVKKLKFAVMGCIVNGPGESKAANIGISLPGSNENPSCPIYIDGKYSKTIKGSIEDIKKQWFNMIDSYLENKFLRK